MESGSEYFQRKWCILAGVHKGTWFADEGRRILVRRNNLSPEKETAKHTHVHVCTVEKPRMSDGKKEVVGHTAWVMLLSIIIVQL